MPALIILLGLLVIVIWMTVENRKSSSEEKSVGPDGFLEINELANSKVEIERVNDRMFIVRVIDED